MSDEVPDFKPGMYRHYKGGTYTALMLAHHHETRELLVIYVSHTHGTVNARPLMHSDGDPDGDAWTDNIYVPGKGAVPRFELLSPVMAPPPAMAGVEDLRVPTGTMCPVPLCGTDQFTCASGVSCAQGHGGEELGPKRTGP